jgi:hypothetical protein
MRETGAPADNRTSRAGVLVCGFEKRFTTAGTADTEKQIKDNLKQNYSICQHIYFDTIFSVSAVPAVVILPFSCF